MNDIKDYSHAEGIGKKTGVWFLERNGISHSLFAYDFGTSETGAEGTSCLFAVYIEWRD